MVSLQLDTGFVQREKIQKHVLFNSDMTEIKVNYVLRKC